MAIINRASFSVDNQRTRQERGPLVHVQIGPGQFRKMYEADAIAAGHIKPAQKSAPAKENKMLKPVEDKATKPPKETKNEPATAVVEPDNFSDIDGVGPATVRALSAAGIETFDQLREASDRLDKILSGRALTAVQSWIERSA